jgi:hypothetical protein
VTVIENRDMDTVTGQQRDVEDLRLDREPAVPDRGRIRENVFRVRVGHPC